MVKKSDFRLSGKNQMKLPSSDQWDSLVAPKILESYGKISKKIGDDLKNPKNKWVDLVCTTICIGLGMAKSNWEFRSLEAGGKTPTFESLEKELTEQLKVSRKEAWVLSCDLINFGFILGKKPIGGVPSYISNGTFTEDDVINIFISQLLYEPPQVMKFVRMGIQIGAMLPADVTSTGKKVRGGSRDQHEWDEIKLIIKHPKLIRIVSYLLL